MQGWDALKARKTGLVLWTSQEQMAPTYGWPTAINASENLAGQNTPMRQPRNRSCPPSNVVQFRGYRPSAWKPKKAARRWQTVWSVGFISVLGAAIGLALGSWSDAGWRLPSVFTAMSEKSECILNVHDGDTIRTCMGERIRIENIDAPEMAGSPKCESSRRRGWCDYALAEESRDALAAMLKSGAVRVTRHGEDRYGRTLARVTVNGRDVGEELIARHFARRWI